MSLARCMLQRAKLPRKYWVESVLHAVYLTNRSPTKAVLNKTPYEAWTGDKPNLSDLKTFGCNASVLYEQTHVTKLQPRSRVCKYLGHRIEGEGHKFLDPKTGGIIVSRNAQFHKLNTLELQQTDITFSEFINPSSFNFFRLDGLPIKKEEGEEVAVEPPSGQAPLTVSNPVAQGPPPVSPAPAAVSTAGVINPNTHTPHTQHQTPVTPVSAPSVPLPSPPHSPTHTSNTTVSGPSVSEVIPQVGGFGNSGTNTTQVSGNNNGTPAPQQSAGSQGGRSSQYPKRDKKTAPTCMQC